MSRRSVVILLATIVIAGAGLSGCNSSGSSAESVQGGVKISQGATNTPPAADAGKLPAGFPKDFPLYTKGVASGSVAETAKGKTFILTMITPDPSDAVAKSYAEKIGSAGYTIVSQGSSTVGGGTRSLVTFRRGKTTGLAVITRDSTTSGQTMIQVQIIAPK